MQVAWSVNSEVGESLQEERGRPGNLDSYLLLIYVGDVHHGINSSTQKYQSTQSSAVLTTCRQDGGSPPF